MAGGGGGTLWIKVLIVGVMLVGGALGMEHGGVGPTWLVATGLGVGGLAIIFASCEAMIQCIEGIAERLKWNQFVAGTMAGLASNIPEVVMLAFVIAKEPRVGFIVVAFTVHVGALAFGIYSGLLPRDETGHAKLPEPLVKLSTDLYACAGGVFLATGTLMLVMRSFHEGAGVPSLSAADLYILGAALLFVEVVAVARLVKRFSSDPDATPADSSSPEPAPRKKPEAKEQASMGRIVFYGGLGIVTSVIGGHAVGDFASILVQSLTAAGYSEMLGALILSVFATAGAMAMIATAHAKGMYDIALANVSGAVTQVPFVVLPIAMILLAIFTQLGVVPGIGGGALAIDLHTTSVMLLAFPPMLLLWKAIQDDGMVNWVETSTMIAIFGLTLYFLAQHG